MRFNGEITIYNVGNENEEFKTTLHRKYLNYVHAEVTEGASSNAEGDKNSDKLFVLIPFKHYSNGYLPPHDYEKCSDKSTCWTLREGDYITLGNIGDVSGYDELCEIAQAYRITEIKSLPFGGIPHWEVYAV